MISSFMLAYITSNKIIHQYTRFLSNNVGVIFRWLKRLRKLIRRRFKVPWVGKLYPNKFCRLCKQRNKNNCFKSPTVFQFSTLFLPQKQRTRIQEYKEANKCGEETQKQTTRLLRV